jgi:diacylglycerol kinase
MKIIKKMFNLTGKAIKGLAKWFKDAGMELIAQAFTLLGFFIAWLTLTGSARDIVGIAVLITTVIWLITIPLRKDDK